MQLAFSLFPPNPGGLARKNPEHCEEIIPFVASVATFVMEKILEKVFLLCVFSRVWCHTMPVDLHLLKCTCNYDQCVRSDWGNGIFAFCYILQSITLVFIEHRIFSSTNIHCAITMGKLFSKLNNSEY